jgi:translation initiation factor 5A
MSPSAENHDFDFAKGDAGASLTFPRLANDLRTGGHVLLDGKPCRITRLARAAPGKHGHAKVMITGVDVFTGKKHEGGGPSNHNMAVPHVRRTSYLLLDVGADGYLALYDLDAGAEKDDVTVPDGELGERIARKFKQGKELGVVVLASMDSQIAVDVVERD